MKYFIMNYKGVKVISGTWEKPEGVEWTDWIQAHFIPERVKVTERLTYDELLSKLKILNEFEKSGPDSNQKKSGEVRAIKSELNDIKNDLCYIPGRFNDKAGRKESKNILGRSMIALDIDDDEIGFDELNEKAQSLGTNYLLHTTFKSSELNQRFRLLIPLDREINEDEYRFVFYRIVDKYFQGLNIDLGASERYSQPFYYPLIPTNGQSQYFVDFEADQDFYHVGDITEERLEKFEEEHPRTSSKSKKSKNPGRNKTNSKEFKILPDPRKHEIYHMIGAFCSKYNFFDLLTHPKFNLQKFYTYGNELGNSLKYLYYESESGEPAFQVDLGVVCPEAPYRYVHSYSSTDPIGTDYWINIYDLVVIHCFEGDYQQMNDYIFEREKDLVIEYYNRKKRNKFSFDGYRYFIPKPLEDVYNQPRNKAEISINRRAHEIHDKLRKGKLDLDLFQKKSNNKEETNLMTDESLHTDWYDNDPLQDPYLAPVIPGTKKTEPENPNTDPAQINQQNDTPKVTDQDQSQIKSNGISRISHKKVSYLKDLKDVDRQKKIPTGIPQLDNILGKKEGARGIRKGLCIIIGKPGMGKSSLALQISDNMAQEHPVLYISLEMAEDDLHTKSISRFTKKLGKGIDFEDIDDNFEEIEADPDNYKIFKQAYDKYFGLKKYVFDTESKNFSVNDVLQLCEKIKKIEGEYPIVFIDYMQLLKSDSNNNDIRVQNEENVLDLKRVSLVTKLPVIALSSLSREGYKGNKPAGMEHIRESGAGEFTAETVISMNDVEGQSDLVKFKVEKQRFGAPHQEAIIKFEKEYSYFDESEPDQSMTQTLNNRQGRPQARAINTSNRKKK